MESSFRFNAKPLGRHRDSAAAPGHALPHATGLLVPHRIAPSTFACTRCYYHSASTTTAATTTVIPIRSTIRSPLHPTAVLHPSLPLSPCSPSSRPPPYYPTMTAFVAAAALPGRAPTRLGSVSSLRPSGVAVRRSRRCRTSSLRMAEEGVKAESETETAAEAPEVRSACASRACGHPLVFFASGVAQGGEEHASIGSLSGEGVE